MSFRTNKSIFYHIPRTGGTFVKNATRQALTNIEGSYGRSRGDYEVEKNETEYWRFFLAHVLQLKREHRTQWEVSKEDRNLFSFAFVREPFSWYKSFWAFRERANRNNNNWRPGFPLDFAWDPDFEKFIKNSLTMFPNFVTILYQCYLGKDGNDLDFVGKQESLREDLIKALTLAGEDFSKNLIRSKKRFNLGASQRGLNYSFDIGSKLERRIRIREKWVYQTFYK